MTLDEAREAMLTRAVFFAGRQSDITAIRALCDAASVYAAERLKSTRKPQMKEGRNEVLPFGRERGVPLDQAQHGQLTWVRGVLAESIDDPTKSRWREANQRLLEAIDRELATR